MGQPRRHDAKCANVGKWVANIKPVVVASNSTRPNLPPAVMDFVMSQSAE
jgi:hypothetical protein